MTSILATEVDKQFPPMQNDRILRAIRRQLRPDEPVPVWAMRQAGRYLPEFRELRAENEFFRVCQTPELACEITLQPIRRFDFDAAIIFSDILVVPQAMGMEVLMVPGEGPKFPNPLRTPEDFSKLVKPDVRTALKYVYDAITLTRQQLGGKVPLLGFTGAPWTLMSYMVEGGGGSKTAFSKSKRWFYVHPEATRDLLSRITETIIEYMVCQAQAGAQAIQVFDSWAGEVSPDTYAEFMVPSLARIAKEFKARVQGVPLILFTKGATHHASVRALVGSEDGYDVMGLDYTAQVPETVASLGATCAYQGNLDPTILYADEATIRAHVRKMLTQFDVAGQQLNGGYIANLGHGLSPDHDPERVGAFIKAVHEISLELRIKPAQ